MPKSQEHKGMCLGTTTYCAGFEKELIFAYLRNLSTEFTFKETAIAVRIISILVFALFLFFPKPVCAQPAEEAFDILMILPLTGKAAMWGVHTRNGALLAYDSLGTESRKKIKVHFEDDQLDRAKALSAFRGYADSEADLVVLFGGQSGSALLPVLENRRIPSFTITAKQGLVEDKEFAFRHWIDSKTQAKLLVSLLTGRNVKKTALYVATHEATIDMADEFEEEAKANNIAILFKAEYPPEERDFRILIAKMKKQSAVQAVVLALLPGQLSVFLRQRKEMGVELPLFGFSTVENGAELKAAAGAMEGIIYVGPSYASTFIDAYKEKYGVYPETAAGNAYDIILMVSNALEKGFRSAEQLAEYFRTLKAFSGAMGRYPSDSHNDFLLPAVLKTVRGQEFRVLDTGETARTR